MCPGMISSFRLPTAPTEIRWVTPSFFKPQMFARKGISVGSRTCPIPWRGMKTTGMSYTSPVRKSDDGLPKGVSI